MSASATVEQATTRIEELETRLADYSTASIKSQIAVAEKDLREASLAERQAQQAAIDSYNESLEPLEAAFAEAIEAAEVWCRKSEKYLALRDEARGYFRKALRLGVKPTPFPGDLATRAQKDSGLKQLLFRLRTVGSSSI